MTPTDMLALVADQLSTEEKATLVASLAIEKMISSLQAPDKSVTLLDSPFTTDPFFVFQSFRMDEDNKPISATATLWSGTPDGTPKMVMTFLRVGSETTVRPLVDSNLRADLEGFAGQVWDAIAAILDDGEEEALEQAA